MAKLFKFKDAWDRNKIDIHNKFFIELQKQINIIVGKDYGYLRTLPVKSGFYYQLVYSGDATIKKFIDWIYENSNENNRLKRKYDLSQDYFNNLSEIKPQRINYNKSSKDVETLRFEIDEIEMSLTDMQNDERCVLSRGALYHRIKNLNLNPNQKLLFLHIWHLDNNWTDRHHYLFARKILEQEIPNPFAFVHMNLECKSELYYDFVWNRQKVYFTDYNTLDLTDRINTADGDIKNFELMSIDKHYDIIPNLRKKFLSPNRIYKEFTHTRFSVS